MTGFDALKDSFTNRGLTATDGEGILGIGDWDAADGRA